MASKASIATNSVYRVKDFRDTVHNHILIPEVIVDKIIDTPLFQRLQDVEQTGMRPLFPAAKHNRFIHSLGVYYLGERASRFFVANAKREMTGDELLGSAEIEGVEDLSADFDREFSVADQWWDKYRLLFVLACLLHDCAHAPFSHAYEFYYDIQKEEVDEEWLHCCIPRTEKIAGFKEDFVAEAKKLDKFLLAQYDDRGFWADFGVYDIGNWVERDKAPRSFKSCCKAKQHEKLSAAMIKSEYGHAIEDICRELLPGNVLACRIVESDIEFMARCVIGLKYPIDSSEGAVERSIKNCFINLLNSDMVDVDGLDYIVRDAYNSGFDNGRIDYDRLFRSLSMKKVYVVKNASVENESIDGLWLGGSQLHNIWDSEQPGMRITGHFSLAANAYENDLLVPVAKLEKAELDWLDIPVGFDQRNCKTEGNPVVFSSALEPVAIKAGECSSFVLKLQKACKIEGRFSGKIEGTFIPAGCMDLHGESAFSKSSFCCYELVYDKSCLSVLIHAIDARNFEYQWIYSHHKVLFQTSFLLCYLLRTSARYLCCRENELISTDHEKTRDFVSCKGCDVASDNDPDFVIPKILGFDSYVDGNHIESNYVDMGFLFYRSSDSDIRSLFKQVMLENRKTGSLVSKTADRYFDMYFSRCHQQTLWKSQNEFEYIFGGNAFTSNQRKSLRYLFIEPGSSSQEAYIFPEEYLAQLLEENGIKNPVFVPSKLSIKSIDANIILVKNGEEVVRLCDMGFSQSATAPRSEFFYLYGDFDRNFTVEDIRELFKTIIKKNNEHRKEEIERRSKNTDLEIL